MHHPIRLLVLAAVAACALAHAPAQAQSQTVKLGYIYYDPHSKTNGITGIGIPPGADADVKGAGTLVFTYEVEVKPNVGVEFVLGLPPKIKAVATGPLAFLGEVLEARNVAPTVLVNYHFGSAGDTWRPYLGFGLNYTHFTNISTPYGWDVKLTDSAGMAVQAGMDYALSKQWGLYASVARVDVRTKLVATGATVLQSTIDFRPWTYSFGASYKF